MINVLLRIMIWCTIPREFDSWWLQLLAIMILAKYDFWWACS